MSKKYYLLIYILLIILIVSSLVFILKSLGINLIKSDTISTQNAYIHTNIININPQIQAQIKKIYKSDYAKVKQGELLLELDCSDYELAALKAQTELDKAQTAKNKLSLNEQLNEQECKKSEYEIKAAKAKATNLAAEFNRVYKMFNNQAASKKAYESAEAANLSAEAALKASEVKANECELKASSLKADLKLAELNILSAETALNLAGRNVSRCKISAPFSGALSAFSANVGDLISPAKSVVKLISNERWAVANIKESDLDGLKIGDKVSFSASGSNKLYSGYVEQISAATGNELSLMKMDNSVGNFIKITQRVPVKIHINEASSELASGQSLKLKIYKNESK